MSSGIAATPYNAAAWLLDRNLNEGRGSSVAIRTGGVDVNYDDVMTSTWLVQNTLAALDISVGQRVIILANDGADMVAWLLGCMRSGVIPIPVSTMLTEDEVRSIAEDSQAVLLVTSRDYASSIGISSHEREYAPSVSMEDRAQLYLRHGLVLAPWAGAIVVGPGFRLHDVNDFTDRSEAPVAATTADSPAFWLYSSGTTGTPKGVMHRHDNMEATYNTYARKVLHVTSEDRFLSVAKLFFAYGLGNSLTFPFGAGATAILEPARPTPASFRALVAAEQPSLFFASPGFVAALLDADIAPSEFASVRATVTAGETLPADLQRRFSEQFRHPVLDGIGSTEALHIFLSNTISDQRPGSTGVAVPGYELRLLSDEDREVTEPDVPGYLHVRGPSTAIGYWDRPEATAAAFREDGWVRTGDVYTQSADGHWTFLGRNNDMIKAGGIWVSPAEVEAVLIEHEDVLEVAVVGTRNDAGLEEVVAFVVPKSGHTVDAVQIDAHCRDRMAAFKRPRQLFVVDVLPKTATGKIKRFSLRDRLSETT
jgi:benzoate-CoA ligase family protein